MFKDKRFQEICGALVILGGMIIFLSLVSFNPGDEKHLFRQGGVKNIIGPLGAALAYGFHISFGFASYIFCMAVLWAGSAIFRSIDARTIGGRLLAYFFLAMSFAGLISIFKSGDPLFAGGAAGSSLHRMFVLLAGDIGSCLIILVMNICALILLGFLSIIALLSEGGKLRLLGQRILSIRRHGMEEVPLVDIEPAAGKKKMPWIEKRRIILYDPNALRNLPGGGPTEAVYEAIPEGDYIEEVIQPEEKHAGNISVLNVPVLVEKKVYSGRDVFEAEFREVVPDITGGSESLCGTVTTLPEGNLVVLEEDDGLTPGTVQEDTEFRPLPTDELSAEEYDFREEAGIDEEPFVKETEMADPEPKPYSKADDIRRGRIHSIHPEEKSSVSKTIALEKGDYSVPVNYLHFSQPRDNESYEQEIKRNSVLLVNTLLEFGIESRVVNVNRGPVITLYEMQIAPGIKVNKIVSLSDDIAMALAASRVRIVAPIPGKSAIGVEVPNKEREMVTLGDILGSDKYQAQTGSLKVALGKDVLGKPVTLDLKKLPHLLIAGATGSGKSVCVNGIITSIVYNYDPTYVRFILVDPKMVELQVYNGLPHLLTPVITEPHMAPLALKWAIYEMEKRYRLLSEMNTRDIERYNEKIRETGEKREPLPYIITIIDELADLMMVASKDIEGYITRIAQKARAVGIHLVLATQRPSVDIITGIIKANFPARIAFQVAQKTDSRTIIDQNGAEKLLGKGDMLYQSPMSSFPVRVQGAFIGEDEIGRVVDHLSGRYDVRYIDLEECLVFTEEEKAGEEGEDELFVDALKIVEETRKASASYQQRRLQIGYNRAARLIEQMEELGYIGPQQGSKPREVFI